MTPYKRSLLNGVAIWAEPETLDMLVWSKAYSVLTTYKGAREVLYGGARGWSMAGLAPVIVCVDTASPGGSKTVHYWLGPDGIVTAC